MKKFRLLTTLFASAICMFSLAGCSTPPTPEEITESIESIIPNPESIQRPGVNIESISFENVPNEIKIGFFDTYGIEIQIVYSDGYVEHYPLLMKNLSNNLKQVFSNVGVHRVSIYFRGHEVTYTFNVVQGVDQFTVTFHSATGSIVRKDEYKYVEGDLDWNKITLALPAGPIRPKDSLFEYLFLNWDKEDEARPGEYVLEDIDVYPLYKKTQKRYDVSKEAVPTIENSKLQLIHKNLSGAHYNVYGACFYVGRLDRVPLLYSASDNPNTTSFLSGDLYFDTISQSKDDYTTALINEIYTKGIDVDTSNYNNYFGDGGSSTPVSPLFYNASTVVLPNILGEDTHVLFEGDIAYSELYSDTIYSFIDGHDESNKTAYSINASDLKDGNNYYRASIETSVDVFVETHYEILTHGYVIRDYKYYFLINNSNTYPVAEYADEATFGSTGNKLSFNMKHLKDLLVEVVEG